MVESISELMKAFLHIEELTVDIVEEIFNQFAKHIANFAKERTGIVVHKNPKNCTSIINVIACVDLCFPLWIFMIAVSPI
jgi:hypothetical protein